MPSCEWQQSIKGLFLLCEQDSKHQHNPAHLTKGSAPHMAPHWSLSSEHQGSPTRNPRSLWSWTSGTVLPSLFLLFLFPVVSYAKPRMYFVDIILQILKRGLKVLVVGTVPLPGICMSWAKNNVGMPVLSCLLGPVTAGQGGFIGEF